MNKDFKPLPRVRMTLAWAIQLHEQFAAFYPLETRLMDHLMDHFTYTAEFTHPLCPYCSSRVPCDQDDPTVPWIGTCTSGHTAIYELDDEDDNT